MNRLFIGALACLALVATVALVSIAPASAGVLHVALTSPDWAPSALDLAGMAIGIGMTTRSSDLARSFELGDQSHVPVVATDIIYEGSAVGDNGSGYGRPLVAGDQFLGFCLRKCDNASGSAGDDNILVSTRGRVQLSVSGAAATDLGKAVYASDDDVFVLTESTNSYIGRIIRYVSSGVVIVAYDVARGGIASSPHVASALAGVDASTAGTFNGTISPTPTGTEVGKAYNHLAIRLANLEKKLID
jgi:hypothetical protein